MISLYPDQKTAMAKLATAYADGFNSPIFVLPTGGGKTMCFTKAAKKWAHSGLRVLVLVHRSELLDQVSAALRLWGVAHGIISADAKITKYPVQVGMVKTLANRLPLDRSGRYLFDRIIIDEAHHVIRDNLWGSVIAHSPNAKLLGVSATPVRLDGKGLGLHAAGFFDTMVIGQTFSELVALGRLARPVLYAPDKPLDLSGIKRRGGDWVRSQLSGYVSESKINDFAVDYYRRHAANEPALAFFVSTKNAHEAAEAFKASGYSAAVLTGQTPKVERKRMLRDLANGSLNLVTSCDVISEGTDIPAVSVGILLRPTESLQLAWQQMGRPARKISGKDTFTLLDLVDNARNHGLPTEDVVWTLDGIEKKKSKGALIKPCPGCGESVSIKTAQCLCGYVFDSKAMASQKYVVPYDVNLVLKTPEMLEAERLQKRRELVGARTKPQLVQLGQQRKYKNPEYWADKILEGRQQYKNQRGSHVQSA
jgi:DNA repair protein RadD